MDLEVIKQNGEKFLLSDYDVVVQDIKIYSIPMLHNRQRIDGFDGSLSYGTEYGDRKIEVTATFIAKDLHDYAHLRDELFNLLNDSNGYYIRELRRLNKKQYDFIGLNEKPKEKTDTDNSYVNGKQYHVELDGDFDFEQDDVYGSTTINFKTSGLPFAESVYTTKELHDTKYNAEASSLITDRDRERFSDTVNKKVDGIEVGGRNLIAKEDIDINTGEFDLSKYDVKGTITIDTKDGIYPGLRIQAKKLERNTDYIIRYKYQKLSGTLESFGGHVDATFKNGENSTYIDGERTVRHSEPDSVFVGDDEKEHVVIYKFRTTGQIEENDYFYIQPNRRSTTPVTVKISEWKLEKGNVATDWSPAPEDFETYDDYIMWFVNSGNFQLEKDGVYGLADDIHIDYQKYVFEENNFSVYNAGNVEIEPESMYMNIIVSGVNGQLEIKNSTTGQLFKLEKPFKGILELKGMSTKMNGTNIFRDTNKRLINLAVGKNDFEVTGNFKDITFDFKYYYK